MLARYGHFTDFPLSFADTPDFHIIVGPNEAGKSTILHGLRDALFGISTRSPFNFVHDYADMRLVAEIGDRNGASRQFQRRKGNKNTLLDKDGRPLPDTNLLPLLGPIDRQFFEMMFGLDHEGLRAGGEALLAADGDAADSLFGSASGLTSILSVSADFSERCNQLFTPRRSQSKPFYQAEERRKEALTALRGSIVTPSDWEALERESAVLGEEHAELEAEIREQRGMHERANRTLRVRPIIMKLKDRQQQVEALGHVPVIGKESIEHGRQALRAKAEAQDRCRQLHDRSQKLQVQIAELNVSDTVLALDQNVTELSDLRGRIVAARQDTPRREQAIESAQAHVTQVLGDLGWSSIAVDAAAAALPPKATRAQVRTLITEHAQLTVREEADRSELQRAEKALKTVHAKLNDLPAPVDVTDLESRLAAIRAKGDLEQQRAEADSARGEASQELAEAVARLPLWNDTAPALSRASVPVADTLIRFEKQFDEATRELDRAGEQLRSADAELVSIQEEAKALATAGDVPTSEAIAAARKHRDAGWHLVRGRYVDEPPTTDDTQIDEFRGGVPLPDAFEASITAADSLVDRKEAEAARVATDESLRQQRERAGRHRDEQLAKDQRAREVLARLEVEWVAAWQPSGITPLTPREMIGWNVQRERVLDLLRGERQATATLDRVDEDVRAGTASLGEALGVVETASASLPTLIAQATSRIDEQRDLAGRRKQLRASEAESASNHDERQRLMETTETGLKQWYDAWVAATHELGQPSDQKPDATAAVLDLFEDLDAACRDLVDEQGRLAAMRRDEDRFSEAVSALELRSSLTLQETEALAVYDELTRVLQEMKTTAALRQTLSEQLEPVVEELASAERDRDESERVLVTLRREASTDSDAELAEIHARAEQRAVLLDEIGDLQSELEDVSDGLSLDQLARDVAASDPDTDRSGIAIAGERLDQINQKFHDLGGQRTQLDHRRSAIETGGDTELHAADLERARAELRDVSEEYALRRAAAGLLTRAIEVVREERQGPILADASDLFARITGHSFEGLAIDFDQSDTPILMGARPSGERVGVSGMSDGTRDQLFLSLRLALVRRYIADASPLPFIADDLLVNFDDARAAAALRALASLSEDTQVIFFTHHVHLAELVKATLGEEEFVLHEIDSG
ncbi:MAG: AAA family ATPase [Chloroflexota bacterium]|nr:AAA family ATPase [Chloroflexota bacterium]